MYLMTIRTKRIVFLLNFHDSWHYTDVIMGTIASQIISLTIVYSTVYSNADQRKYQSSTSLAFVRGIYRRPVNSPHKGPVTRKMFPYDDVIMSEHNIHWMCLSLYILLVIWGKRSLEIICLFSLNATSLDDTNSNCDFVYHIILKDILPWNIVREHYYCQGLCMVFFCGQYRLSIQK